MNSTRRNAARMAVAALAIATFAPAAWSQSNDARAIRAASDQWQKDVAAKKGDGVKPADLYPLDLVRAAKKLDTIKDNIVFWSSGAESQELIGSGEVAMTMIWNGRAWSAACLAASCAFS